MKSEKEIGRLRNSIAKELNKEAKEYCDKKKLSSAKEFELFMLQAKVEVLDEILEK